MDKLSSEDTFVLAESLKSATTVKSSQEEKYTDLKELGLEVDNENTCTF